jgi:hypothetical protein
VTPHDWLWLVSIAIGAWNAWQSKSIELAVLSLKLDLSDRIGRTEGDVRELRASIAKVGRRE